MIKQYRGWVPSVTGRLSFTYLGVTSHPSRCVTTNVADGSSRFLISFQKRKTLDFVVPLLAYAQQKDGTIWCACVAETTSHNNLPMEKLKGRLYLFHSKEAWRSARTKIKDAQKQLNELRHHSYQDGTSPLSSEALPIQGKLCSELQPITGYFVTFELMRSGSATLVYDSSAPISSCAPVIDKDNKHPFMQKVTASQLFFFLKDIAHEHQYHDPHTDTIVDIYEIYENDDVVWRKKTLYSLYRKIIEFKRARDTGSVVKSQGTLAYAKAFKNLSNVELKGTNWEVPYYDDEALHESLDAAHRKLTYAEDANKKKSAKLTTLAFSFIGLSFALASLIRASGDTVEGLPSPVLKIGAGIVVNHTGMVIIAAIALASYIAYPPEGWRWMRNLVRAMQPMKKPVTVISFILLSFSIFGATLYLFSALSP